MNILLFSNGKVAGNSSLLEFGHDWIKEAIQRTKVKKLLFIPFAMIRGEYEERLNQLNNVFSSFGVSVTGIYKSDDPVEAISQADGFIVSGGNTWVLNKLLHDQGLIGPLRKAILQQRKLYIGWSAGTNIACPTIRTTNDMPIVSAAILPSLNLIPFQINPHYIEANISGHMGETRDERIEEFLIQNPHEVVVGIPEGTMLKLEGDQLSYYSITGGALKLFKYKQKPQYLHAWDKQALQDLMSL